jgi:hypothetical protein
MEQVKQNDHRDWYAQREEELDAIEEGIARQVSVLAASRSAKWNFGATRGFLGALFWRKQTCRSEQFFSLSSSYC